MRWHKQFPPQARERLDHALLGHPIGAKLALDHVGAGGLVDAHRSPEGDGAEGRKTGCWRLYRRPSSTTITHRVSGRSCLGVGESANRLPRRQPPKQLSRGQAEPRMPPFGRYVAERRQHEATLVQAGVRQLQCRGRALAAVIVEEVEIERAGGIAGAALAPE